MTLLSNSSSTINQATLTYRATATQTLQGQTPVLNGTVDGLMGRDTLSDLIGARAWSANANLLNPGVYSVVGSGLTSPNYTFTQAQGNATALTVLPATPSQSVNNVTSNIQNPGRNSQPPTTSQIQDVNVNNINPSAGGDGDSDVTNLNLNFGGSNNTSTMTIVDGAVNVGQTLNDDE